MSDTRSADRCGLAVIQLVILLWLTVGVCFAGAPLQITIPSGGTKHAQGLEVFYRQGDPLPGVVAASVTSNLGSVPFSFTSSAAWLQVTASQSTTPASLSIQVNPTGLAVGTYTGTLTVSTTISDGGRIVDWTDRSTITLTVAAPLPATPSAQPASLSFTGAVGQSIAPQTVNLTSSPTSLPFTATASQPWIGFSPAAGVTGTGGVVLSVSINTSGLPSGASSGQINLSFTGGTPATLSIPVTVNLTSAATVIQPPSISFTGTAQQGAAAVVLGSFSPVGASPASLGFTVSVPAAAANWLSVAPPAGTTPALVQVVANPQNLTPGTYDTTLQVNLANGDPASYVLPVHFTVTAPPPVAFAVSLGSFDLNISTANQVSNAVPVTVSATQGSSAASAGFTVSTNQPWLKVVASGSTTPATLSISADASASPLAPGNYNGTVSIINDGVVRTNIQVALAVAAAPVAVFSSQQIELTAQAGSANSLSGSVALNVTTNSASPVNYRVVSNSPWIRLSGFLSGSVSAGLPFTLGVDVNASTLAAGQVVGSITLTTLDAGGATIGTDVASVKVTVTAAPAEIAVDQTLIRLDAVSGAAATQMAAVGITTAAGSTPFTADTAAAWLSVSPKSGTGSQTLKITVDPSKLGPGTYSDMITVSGPTAFASINVQLNVVAPGALSFSLSPTTAALTTQTNIAQPVSTVVVLSDLSSAALGNSVYQWSTSAVTTHGGQWLSASLNTSGFPFTLTVTANPAALATGTYNGTVTVTEQAGTTVQKELPVTFTIQAPQLNSYALSVQSVNNQTLTGDTTLFRQTVGLAPRTAGLAFSTQITLDKGTGWLTLDNNTGVTMPATFDVVLNPAGLAAGIYTGRVTVTATAGAGVTLDSPVQSIPVQLVVADPPQPEITVLSTAPVSFNMTAGSASVNPASAPLVTLGYTGAGFGTAQVSSTASWLKLNAPSYSVSAAGTTVFGSVDAALAPSVPGTYSATYTVTGPNGKVTDGTVTLLVTPGAPSVTLTPEGASVTVGAGSFDTNGSTVTLKNTGSGPVDFYISLQGSWLGLASGPWDGHLAANESVQFVPRVVGSLAAGNYFGAISIIARNEASNVQVVHQVVLQVQTASLAGVTVDQPEAKAGAADGSALVYTLKITNPSSQTLPFTVTSTSLTGTSGQLPGLAISPDTGNIAPNSTRTITVTANAPAQSGMFGNAVLFYVNGVGFEREVIYSAAAAVGNSCAASRIIPVLQQPAAGASLSGSLPAVISAAVFDNCGNAVNGGSVTAHFSTGEPVVSLTSPAGNGIWQGTWVPASRVDSAVIITLIAQDSAGQLSAKAERTVFVTSTTGVPAIDKGGIVNGSDFSRPNIAQAGSYLSISGRSLASGEFSGDSLPLKLGDTQVLLSGTPLGLKSASPTQLMVFVPFGTPTNYWLPLQVVRGNAVSVPQSIFITDKNPALFLASPGGASRAGLFMATRGGTTFQVSTDAPAKAGDVLTATATGLGWAADDGKVTGLVLLDMGGVSVTPTSAVLSPVLLGVYTVQATIPAGVAKSNEVPVSISVDGQASKAVTIAIQ